MSVKKQTNKKSTNTTTKKKTSKPSAQKSRKASPNRTKNSTNSQKAYKKSSKEQIREPLFSPRIKAVFFAAAAVLFAVMIFVKGQNLWTSVRGFFFGLFGFCIVLVPALLVYLSVITEKEQKIAHLKAKMFLCAFIILFSGALIYIATGAQFVNSGFFGCLGNLYSQTADATNYMTFGCGFIGGILGYPLVFLCGSTAALFICIIVLLALVFIIANLSIKDIAKAASKTMERVREKGEQRAKLHRQHKEEMRQHREIKQAAEMKENSQNLHNGAIPISGMIIDIPLDEPKKKPTENSENIINGSDVDVTDSNETNALDTNISTDLMNIINRASKPFGKDKETTVEDIASEISKEKESSKNDLIEKKAEKNRKTKDKLDPNAIVDSAFDNVGYCANIDANPLEKNEVKYTYPPVSLLKLSNNTNDRNAMIEMENNAKKLVETLDSFGVKAKIVNICRGPSVTRYELSPAPGVKISKITNLSDDIALNLAANGVRIEAPIPGKAAVGIEVPNKVVSMVSMRELIDSDKFRKAKSKLTTVLGRDISGEIVVTDLAKMPHLLIAGTTGSGKSVCVNSILMSILYKATPDEVKLLLIDPKMVEFSKYKGIPHLLVPVVSDAKKAAGALGWAVSEMLQRYKIFSEYDCKDIGTYNHLIDKNLKYIAENPPKENEEGEMYQPVMEVNGLPVAKEKMPQVVIAIDELADLMMAAPSEVEDSICRLAQMARAAGMHLILATQRPTVNVITGLIKANVPSRIALRVSSNTDSRTILDCGGGEKLIGKGDMLFAPVGAPKPVRVQGCYASDEEIEGVTDFIKKSAKAEYNDEIEEKIKRIAAEEIAQGKKSNDNSSDDGLDVDTRMDEAVKCVIEAGQASTSMIQRKLRVGYARAGRIIDEMEQMGVVGPHQGSKPRDVIMTYSEWLERQNINGSDE